MRILMVEDNKIIQKAQGLLLDEIGVGAYEVDLADDGRSALRLIQCYNYDIALVDLNLPDIYGVEIIKSLRNHSNVTKIIVATTYINDEIEKNCSDAGGDVILSKPIMLETLRGLF